jgi:uncharacterized membrane protein YhaH (DUF805 family)
MRELGMREWLWFLFSFYGRIGRRVFIFGELVIITIMIVIIIMFTLNWEPPELVLVLAAIVTSLSHWSLAVKRLHDMGCSGLWAAGVFFVASLTSFGLYYDPYNVTLPLTGSVILAVFFFVLIGARGQEKDNAYGPRS